jgi:hypothetical protein
MPDCNHRAARTREPGPISERRRGVRHTRTFTFLALVAALALAVGACGDDAEPVVTSPGDDTTDDPAADASLGGAEHGLAVSVEYVGGFTTPEMAFRQLPVVVVYDDGRTVTQGAVIEIYPGPAELPLVAGELDDGDLQRLADAARDAGLFAERSRDDFGMPPVADAPDTRITVVVDGEEVVTEVGALGFDDAGGMGVSEEQAEQRAAVSEFVELASRLATAGESSELVEVDRYRVHATRYRGGPAEPGLEPNELDWPATVELSRSDCIPVTGDDATALAEVLPEATEITRWIDAGGDAWRLAIRPVLPHEPDC